jgi:UDP-N-acetylglucosamine transferase subunit ALG13
MSAPYRKPLVVVTVGGDHHPFDRLMGWVEDWLFDFGDRARCLVQHGSARAPHGADAAPYIGHHELQAAMAAARAVVSSGGPSTLSEARLLGHRPIAVPRRARLGEHVDDHQRAFCSRLHQLGLVVSVDTEAEFRAALEVALDTPRVVPTPANTLQRETINNVGALIDATAMRGIRQRRPRQAELGQRTLAGR